MDLGQIEHGELVKLMNKYIGVVASNVQQMGKTNAAEIEINLTIDSLITRKNR